MESAGMPQQLQPQTSPAVRYIVMCAAGLVHSQLRVVLAARGLLPNATELSALV